jgi:phosphoglycolate phosphatase-like HAD superfamily hydrolase
MLIALDFDGVLCDGMLEYWQVAWRTYCQVWLDSDLLAPSDIMPVFCQLRPVVETGWEMPVLVKAIVQGVSSSEILSNWAAIAEEIVANSPTNPAELSASLDAIRDRWIERDLTSWLALHRFYPRVVSRLQRLTQESPLCFIITTKEARFTAQLLADAGIDFPRDRIFGKEVKCPKYQTLEELAEKYQVDFSQIYFVEDRLKTLISVKHRPNLVAVNLYLADWGYNTASDRDLAQNDPHIHLLSLERFTNSVTSWS